MAIQTMTLTEARTELRMSAAECNLTEEVAMNMLQDGGIISDNCVNFHSVALADAPEAIEFLNQFQA
jgi:hypothetical protein